MKLIMTICVLSLLSFSVSCNQGDKDHDSSTIEREEMDQRDVMGEDEMNQDDINSEDEVGL